MRLALIILTLLPLVADAQVFLPHRRAFGVDSTISTSGLVAYWKMDEAAGATRVDSYWTNNLTDVLGGVGQDAGMISNSAWFLDSGDELSNISTNFAPLPTGPLAMMGWVFLNSKAADGPIMTKRAVGGTADVTAYRLRYDQATDRFIFQLFNADTTAFVTVTANNLGSPTANTWYFIAAGRNVADGNIYISVNGGTRDTAAFSSSATAGSGVLIDLEVGAHTSTSPVYLNGDLDEWSFWQAEVSEDTIDALYNNGNGKTLTAGVFVDGSPGPTNTLILHYAFTEGSGTTIADSSGNGYNGSLSGATWVTGKSGSGFALQFDGVNDSAQTATITFGANVVTLCAWVYWDAFSNNDDLLWELSANWGSNANSFLFDPNESQDGGTKAATGVRGTTGFRHETFTRWSAVTWTHIAVVYDNSTATGDVKVYVNGTAVSTSVLTNTKTGTSNFGNYVLYLFSRAGASLFGAGRLDDFRIYSGELGPAGINDIKDSPQ